MLDVIGAGATATSTIDWGDVWNNSKEASRVQEEIEQIHREGRQRPPVETLHRHTFATSWWHQLRFLTKRAFQSYWRNPTYLMAKMVLNIAAGLFLGFTFWKAKGTLQGTQNKLFVRCDGCSFQINDSEIFSLPRRSSCRPFFPCLCQTSYK